MGYTVPPLRPVSLCISLLLVVPTVPGMQLLQAQACIPTISKGGSVYIGVVWLPVKRLRALENGQGLEASVGFEDVFSCTVLKDFIVLD